jgi:hypothetical protein
VSIGDGAHRAQPRQREQQAESSRVHTTDCPLSINNLSKTSYTHERSEVLTAVRLRNAVVELLTIIDDSDDLDVVVTVADDGTVTVAAVEPAET